MGTNPKRLVPFQLVPFQLVLKQVGSNKLERHLFEQIVFRLEPNESTFCPLNGSRPDESIRSALDYSDLSEPFACAFGQSSAVPTIWAKCFALTPQKFKKVADRHSLARQVGTALVGTALGGFPEPFQSFFRGHFHIRVTVTHRPLDYLLAPL